ncbi:hypothetical protein [Pseudomonas marincola]|uniref:hypothetical protein n=1 Tax=Pseudomonas marincola TaxID=437900 RepID=UPI0008E55DF3|nr:hypothetical protein [Pseudomonas marincola]SFT48907.1 hypothetical protein SAMN05216264_101588 [Pseudomonas marincola]
MIDIEKIKKLSPRDGDVFVLPITTPGDIAASFAEALNIAVPGLKATVIIGEAQQLSTAQMNAAGWYRA